MAITRPTSTGTLVAPPVAPSGHSAPALQAHTLENLRYIIANDRWDLTVRDPEVLKRYTAWTEEVVQKYVSVEDYMIHHIFNPPQSICPTTSKIRILLEAQTITSARPIFRKNEYPYLCETGLEHYCLWSFTELSPLQIEEVLAEEFNQVTRDGSGEKVEYVWFVNPMHRKTIKGLWHAHVFWKRVAAIQR